MNRLIITIGLLALIFLSIEIYEESEITREEWAEIDMMVLEDRSIIKEFDKIYEHKTYISHRDMRNLRKLAK